MLGNLGILCFRCLIRLVLSVRFYDNHDVVCLKFVPFVRKGMMLLVDEAFSFWLIFCLGIVWLLLFAAFWTSEGEYLGFFGYTFRALRGFYCF